MALKPEHIARLKDKHWRLNNLYWITDKSGKPVRFRMTPEQLEYFEGMHTRNIILKARQLGFTTEVCIIQLDEEGAAAAAEKAYSDATNERMAAVRANMGLLETAASSLADTAKGMWDALLNLGRTQSYATQLKAIDDEIEGIQKNQKEGVTLRWGDTSDKDIARLKEQRKNLEFAAKSQEGYAAAQKESQKVNEAGIAAQKLANDLYERGATASQGYPVPLLYGKRRIGGAIISAGIYVEDKQ